MAQLPFDSGGDVTATTHNFVSVLGSLKPDIDEELTERYGSQRLSGLLDIVGAKKPAHNIKYSHFEEDWKMPKIKATQPASPAAGALAVFTLDAAAIASITDQDPHQGTAVSKTFPVREKDTLLIKPTSGSVGFGTYIRAIVTAIDKPNDQFTAYPIDILDTIPTITAADEIVIYGNAHGSGSGQPDAISTTVTEFNNHLQIIKDKYEITGTGKHEKTWFSMPQSNEFYWMVKGEEDAVDRMMNNRENTLLVGEKLANVNVANIFSALNEPLTMTEGLIPFIFDRGNVVNYTGITGPTIGDFKEFVVDLDANKGSKMNMMFNGIQFNGDLDDEIGDRTTNGGVTYGNFNFTMDQAVNFQFQKFLYNGYTFDKRVFDCFNDLPTLGAAGYGFRNEGITVPTDMRMSADPYGQGERVHSLRLRYLAGKDGESREFDIEYFNGLKHSDSGKDVEEIRYLSHCGFEGFAGNRYGYWKRA